MQKTPVRCTTEGAHNQMLTKTPELLLCSIWERACPRNSIAQGCVLTRFAKNKAKIPSGGWISKALCLVAAVAAIPFQPLQAAWVQESAQPLSSRSSSVTHTQISAQDEDRVVEMHLVKFDRSHCALRVLDLAPGATVAETVRAKGGLAGVNGGYFKRDHTPLGLVISNGVELHPLENSKILTGVLAVTGRGASLLRTGEIKRGNSLREALQAGPFLVDRGKPVAGLNATRRAERTVLLADVHGVVALLTTSPVTLAELGQILASPGVFPELKISRALNLDGGSSTALWVDAVTTPYSRPEWKAVRNAVAVVPLVKKAP